MSELTRTFAWDEKGRPVMVIFKKQRPRVTYHAERRQVEGYVIDLNDAYMYSRDHYPAMVPCFYGYDGAGDPMIDRTVLTYDEAMFAKCAELCYQFGLGLVTSRKMAEIASLIEGGIDELAGMPPRPEAEKQVVGEARITLTGQDGSKIEKTIDV